MIKAPVSLQDLRRRYTSRGRPTRSEVLGFANLETELPLEAVE
jgi:hypothetical protein